MNLEHIYDLVFRFGSEATHSGAATLAGLHVVEGKVVSVLDEPSVPASNEVLLMASWCYLGLLETAVRCVGPLGAAHAATLAALEGDFDALAKRQGG